MGVVLISLLLGMNSAVDQPVSRLNFVPGQVWRYHTRAQDLGSSLTILKIDPPEEGVPQIIHIRVENVRMRMPWTSKDKLTTLEHLPIQRDALESSVSALLETRDPPPLPPDYDEWQASGGSAYATPVADSVDFIEQHLIQYTATP